MSPRVAQGTPRGADSHQKSAQRGPREVPKERKIRKNENYDTLILNDPIGFWVHLHPSGGPRNGKKLTEFARKTNNVYEHTKSRKKTQRRPYEIDFVVKILKKGSYEECRRKSSHAGEACPGPNSSHHPSILGSLGLRRMSSDTPART